MNKKIKILVLICLLLLISVSGVAIYLNRNWVKNQFLMQSYVYDNGIDTKFKLKFYKDSEVIPASSLRIELSEDNKSNAITETKKETGFVLMIAKKHNNPDLDIRKKKFCTEPGQTVFTYNSKITNQSIPVCLAAADDYGGHGVYITQIDRPGGYHVVTISHDFDSKNKNPEKSKRILRDSKLNQKKEDIKYILSSIEII